MAGLAAPGLTTQMALVAELRWRIAINSVRTLRGKLQMFGSVAAGVMMGIMLLSLGPAMGAGAWYLVSHGRQGLLPGLFLVIFGLWQFAPLFAAVAQRQFDFSGLLRFPIRFSSFVILSVAYGVIEPAGLAGIYWLICVTAGIAVADRSLLGCAMTVAAIFAALNVFLARAVLTWLEHWLARRRTRELLGFFLLLVIMSVQFIGPVAARLEGRRPDLSHLRVVSLILQATPPGLAGSVLIAASRGEPAQAAAWTAGLAAFAILFASLLLIRLRAQFAGEEAGEAPGAATTGFTAVSPGWGMPGVPGRISAIIEKEIRYLSRSGPTLFLFVVPVMILAIFAVTPDRPGKPNPFGQYPDIILPIAVAYSTMLLGNLVYNCFGYDAKGIERLLISPVRFQDMLIAKNLASAAISLFEVAVITLVVALVFAPPPVITVAFSMAWLLFALLAHFSAGNIVSLYFPRKLEFGSFRSQRASGMAMMFMLATQLIIAGIGAVLLIAGRRLQLPGTATLIQLGLVAIAYVLYARVLRIANRIGLEQRDTLLEELGR